MAENRPQDRYANIAAAQVVMSGADAETFTELITGISLGQGKGMLIDQIDYHVAQAALEDLVATGDSLQMGWTTSNVAGSLGLTRRTTIHIAQLMSGPIIGTPASAGLPISLPLVYQFNPSMIVATPRLYLAADSNSLAAAASVTSRFYFRYIDLTTREYLELAEAYVLVG